MTRLNSLRWKGYFYDVETGLYYINGRWYDPETRRYISPTDHTAINLLSPNGANRYAFENGNFVDNAYSRDIARAATFNGIPLYNCRGLPSIPKWASNVSTSIEHSFSIINPIRTAVYIDKYPNLWYLMRLDGVTELPGALSKFATGIGWGLSIAGGVIVGYEKYASGASISSAVAGGIINAGINIGGMYASTALASLSIGFLAAAGVPGVIVVAIGAAVAILTSLAINYLFTELRIGGNTIEGHLNDFVDWLIFWD